jgi:hypothetical protein
MAKFIIPVENLPPPNEFGYHNLRFRVREENIGFKSEWSNLSQIESLGQVHPQGSGVLEKISYTTVVVENLSTWTSLNSNFGTSSILSLAYHDNVWIAVGAQSQVRRSTDTVTWNTVTPGIGTIFDINKVIHNNGIWHIVANTGRHARSSNGTNWTTSFFTIDNYRNIAATGNNVIACGDSNRLFYSTNNGITWFTGDANFSNSGNILSATYGNNIFVIGNSSGNIRYALPGTTTWAFGTSNFGTSSITQLSYQNDTWIGSIANDRIIRSTNGISWTSDANVIGFIDQIIFNNNKWIMTRTSTLSGQLLLSTNAITWTTLNTNNSAIKFLTANDKTYVAAGSGASSSTLNISEPIESLEEILLSGGNFSVSISPLESALISWETPSIYNVIEEDNLIIHNHGSELNKHDADIFVSFNNSASANFIYWGRTRSNSISIIFNEYLEKYEPELNKEELLDIRIVIQSASFPSKINQKFEFVDTGIISLS